MPGQNPRQPSPIQTPEQSWYSDPGWKTRSGNSPGDPEQRSQTGRFEVKYLIVIEKSKNGFGAHVPDLPGCIAAADSRQEVIRLIHEAIEFHIDSLQQDSLPIPRPSSTAEFIEIS